MRPLVLGAQAGRRSPILTNQFVPKNPTAACLKTPGAPRRATILQQSIFIN